MKMFDKFKILILLSFLAGCSIPPLQIGQELDPYGRDWTRADVRLFDIEKDESLRALIPNSGNVYGQAVLVDSGNRIVKILPTQEAFDEAIKAGKKDYSIHFRRETYWDDRCQVTKPRGIPENQIVKEGWKFLINNSTNPTSVASGPYENVRASSCKISAVRTDGTDTKYIWDLNKIYWEKLEVSSSGEVRLYGDRFNHQIIDYLEKEKRSVYRGDEYFRFFTEKCRVQNALALIKSKCPGKKAPKRAAKPKPNKF